MKKFLIFIFLFLYTTNSYAVVFEKCYLVYDSRGAKKPETKFNTKNLDKFQFEVYRDKGLARRTTVYNDKYLKTKNPKYFKKVNTLVYKISYIDESIIVAVNDDGPNRGVHFIVTITLDLKKGQVKEEFVEKLFGNISSRNVEYRCKIKGSASGSSYLDYWWALILIIAITFFIFTQSGKRLKKIRRK